ncbi:MAG: hypothetical protein RLZZ262_743 [Bacteroidota bacterium]|jgi:hypothetical protein
MMQEDRLYNQFKSQLENYSPEVPAAVYSGMRRKLWLSQFLKFNATSLNVWYVGTALMLGAGLWLTSSNVGATAQLAKSHSSEITYVPVVAQESNGSCVQLSSCANYSYSCGDVKANRMGCGLTMMPSADSGKGVDLGNSSNDVNSGMVSNGSSQNSDEPSFSPSDEVVVNTDQITNEQPKVEAKSEVENKQKGKPKRTYPVVKY